MADVAVVPQTPSGGTSVLELRCGEGTAAPLLSLAGQGHLGHLSLTGTCWALGPQEGSEEIFALSQ